MTRILIPLGVIAASAPAAAEPPPLWADALSVLRRKLPRLAERLLQALEGNGRLPPTGTAQDTSTQADRTLMRDATSRREQRPAGAARGTSSCAHAPKTGLRRAPKLARALGRGAAAGAAGHGTGRVGPRVAVPRLLRNRNTPQGARATPLPLTFRPRPPPLARRPGSGPDAHCAADRTRPPPPPGPLPGGAP